MDTAFGATIFTSRKKNVRAIKRKCINSLLSHYLRLLETMETEMKAYK